MGIISIHLNLQVENSKIPRIKATLKDITAIGSVDNIPYFVTLTPPESLFYRKLNVAVIQDKYSDLDFLWKMSWTQGGTVRPGWSKMMQMVQQGPHTSKQAVNFLPIIDMNLTDYTCINSTLHFICKDAAKHNAAPTIIDNPLYLKARTIIENEPESSTIKINFLGTIGHIMTGTGFDTVLAQIYAETAYMFKRHIFVKFL